MIINDFENKVGSTGFSKVVTVDDDDEDTVYVFPKTTEFIAGIQKKKNAEKLHRILGRVKV